MNTPRVQAEFFGIIARPVRGQFHLRVNDIVRIQGRLCRVIRVTESAAVVIMNRLVREFRTLFDKHVRFQPAPARFRISPNSDLEILNRNPAPRRKRKDGRRIA